MKKEEKIAKDYLGIISNDVVFEPDGNIPPDFKLNQVIAVEVRRLNKNIFGSIKPKGIEQEEIPLIRALSKVFREFASPIPIERYRIKLRFSRPIGKISNIEAAAKSGLSIFLQNKPATPFEIALSRNVSITIYRANRKSTEIFYIGILSDRDSGGWVAPIYIENINHCIAEKTNKIQYFKSKYSEWWLILVDFLLGGIGEPEKTNVIRHINKGADWKKIVIIHPETKKEILKIGSSNFVTDEEKKI